jgi:pSer/pThr/pTyr-binding forkhead associated (FHA) protein
MAMLKNSLSGETCLLRAHHLFGRDRARCDTLLATPYASRIHAQIRWMGAQWVIEEYSRNGTWLSGARLYSGERAALCEGDLIRFTEDSAPWRVDDLGDPTDMLWPLNDQAGPIVLTDRLALPASTDGMVCLQRSADEGWLLCTQTGQRSLTDGDEIVCGQQAWRLCLAPRADTLALLLPDTAQRLQRIDFMVSQDEEHVRALLHTPAQTIDLGERAHHYCLATLARARFAAQQSGHDATAQGWLELEQLARMLGLAPLHINVQIHRARRQLTALRLHEVDRLLERRRGAVRFGSLAFRVFRGEALECQWQPDAAGSQTRGIQRR